MAKFSISVPDPEWERARAVGGDLNASQLVQAALRQFVESRTRKPAFALHRPEDAAGLIDEAAEKLSVLARRAFEVGYRAGARFGREESSWGPIDLFAGLQWNYDRWVATLGQDYRQNREFGDVYEYFESLSEDTGFAPGSVWEMGFTEALRDVWRAVVEERPPASVGDGEDANQSG